MLVMILGYKEYKMCIKKAGLACPTQIHYEKNCLKF